MPAKNVAFQKKKIPNFENLFYVIQAMLWSEIVTEVADICNLATKKKIWSLAYMIPREKYF